MNGDIPVDDTSSFDFYPAPDETVTSPGFFDVASSKLSSIFTASVNPPPPIYTNDYPYGGSAPTLGGEIMDAIYSYGAGKVSLAQTKLRNAILNTGEGKRIVGAAQAQTVQQYTPIIVFLVVMLLLAGIFLGRR
jgi:hypothetical protein